MTYDNYKSLFDELDEGGIAKKFPDFDQYWGIIKSLDVKYPKLQLSITPSDVEDLIDLNGYLKYDQMKSPVEKLLYAVLWKQGDLSKVRYIVDGIEGKKSIDQNKKGMIFHQFGKHLSSTKEPIIDKNVLKSYAYYKDRSEVFTKSGVIKSSIKLVLAKEYIRWVKSLSYDTDHQFMVDRIMFSIGKTVKLES